MKLGHLFSGSLVWSLKEEKYQMMSAYFVRVHDTKYCGTLFIVSCSLILFQQFIVVTAKVYLVLDSLSQDGTASFFICYLSMYIMMYVFAAYLTYGSCPLVCFTVYFHTV